MKNGRFTVCPHSSVLGFSRRRSTTSSICTDALYWYKFGISNADDTHDLIGHPFVCPHNTTLISHSSMLLVILFFTANIQQ